MQASMCQCEPHKSRNMLALGMCYGGLSAAGLWKNVERAIVTQCAITDRDYIYIHRDT